jgi:DNA-binding NarL/FixJ family response regulator
VLLVDDHTLVRRGLARLLEFEPDIQVVGEAADGPEALEQVRRFEPDVVIMDVSMPGMSGVETTRRIKDERPDIRIIGLSMHDMDGTEKSMRRAGAESYLTKDGPPEKLLETIRRAPARDD